VGFPLGVTAGTYLNLFDLTLTSLFAKWTYFADSWVGAGEIQWQ
jgi:hypothetical protein